MRDGLSALVGLAVLICATASVLFFGAALVHLLVLVAEYGWQLGG